MSNKEDELYRAWLERPMTRRALLDKARELGIAGVSAGFLMNTIGTRALAASDSFNWQRHKGKTVRLLLNKHPYADTLIANLENFKKLTGMNVEYDIFPEDVYFDKVTSALTSGSSQYDVFMTGAYQTWQYGPAGWLVDVNEFIRDPAETANTFRWDDVLPNLRASTAWSGKVGDPLGGPDSKQWAMPLGFELYSLSYNKAMLDKAGIAPPEDLPDLVDKAKALKSKVDGAYGIGVRGSRSWATIHPGYLSGYTNYGGRDFVMEAGKLRPAMNSPEAKAFTRLWIDMIQKAGPTDWTSYTWYEVGNDLGAGTSAMMYDADIIGFFQEQGSKQAGNIAYQPFAANPEATDPTSNVWIWSLAMSNFARDKSAAWYFLQWATGSDVLLHGATEGQVVDPVRRSVAESPGFQERMQASYLEQYRRTVGQAKIYFTPQPLFFNVTTQWAAQLQKMYAGQISVDEGLDQLAERVSRQLESIGLT